MAISKLILNGETQMDVTSNTNVASNMLNGVIGTKNDGTKVTGNIASKSSDDLTASGATVTAPAGYYANAASKAVATTTHPNPSASITSSTGVVTASHTQGTGYVTGGTTTGTLNLTTQAGKTVTPTESAQTAVASYRWTTGNVNVAAISSTYVGTGVTTRSSANLTASGSVVTAPAGYYSTAATKSIAAGSAFPPAVTITKAPTIGVNTSGVVTASYNGSSSITPTVTSGYISQGTAGTISTTGTSTYQLTSKAAATYYPSTADQTIASQRWLVGAQTIKSVTTSNLTAANIKSGTVVKVGDANNASRITQVTGTLREGIPHTARLQDSGNSSYCYVQYNGVKYYTVGDTFTFYEGDTLTIYLKGNNGAWFQVGAAEKNRTSSTTAISTTYSLPGSDINIFPYYYNMIGLEIHVADFPLETPGDEMGWISPTEEQQYFSVASFNYGFGNFTIGGIDSTYVGTGVARQAAATYYPSTADQTIASQRWLTGNQTIKSVTTSNLTAANIAEGVVVKVGDSANASRITQVTGTHKGGGDSGSGASNFIQGTFTAGTAGTVQTINVPYTGSGYPIALAISVEGGTYTNNSGNANAQAWYDVIHQYAIGYYSMSKCGATNNPQYVGTNIFIDGATVMNAYKSSASDNNIYSRNFNIGERIYKTGEPGTSSTDIVTISTNTTIKVRIAGESSGYGFLSGLIYSYYVVYSE